MKTFYDFVMYMTATTDRLIFTLAALFILFRFLEVGNKLRYKARIIMKHGYPPEHCDVFGNGIEAQKHNNGTAQKHNNDTHKKDDDTPHINNSNMAGAAM